MEKIKLFLESEKGKDLFVILIVILVGICSFFLGRLSTEYSNNGLKIEYNGQEASVIDSMTEYSFKTPDIEMEANNAEVDYFASKRGKKYYSISCSAGKTIKEENRIYFSDATSAEKAGFTPSASCR